MQFSRSLAPTPFRWLSCEVPPVPIPNTEVKLTYTDNTWLATAREDRQPPGPQRGVDRKIDASLSLFRTAKRYITWARRAHTSLLTLAKGPKPHFPPAAKLHSFIPPPRAGQSKAPTVWLVSCSLVVILKLCRRISERTNLYRVKAARFHQLRSEILPLASLGQDDTRVRSACPCGAHAIINHSFCI